MKDNQYIKQLDYKIMSKTVKYSIPIYENGIKTKWTIDGIIGDEKYIELIKYHNGKDLPLLVNVKIKIK